ncbi:IPT/TIG domain-containing protein [Flagellimonas algicola]|nr:IPT/TIG domain-containing protein [Allomuricauda algicola]
MKTLIKFSVILMIMLAAHGCSSDDRAIITEPEGTVEEVKTPTISEINPTKGPKETEVSITGKNFGTDPNRVEVYFNDNLGTIKEVTDNQIKVVVPQMPGYASGTGNIVVKVENMVLDGPEFTYLSTGLVSTYSGSSEGDDDGPLEQAKYSRPIGIAMDNLGHIYIADAENHRIRQIAPDGSVITLAGGKAGDNDGVVSLALFDNPRGIAVDELGTIYIADFNNHKIKKITNVGIVVTVAGSTEGFQDGQGTEAKFAYPEDIALDGQGNILVADGYNSRIRKISPDGEVTTLAGGDEGFADGPSHLAQFYYPSGLAVDEDGNIFVVDEGNHKIRKITPEGMVSTLAGSDNGYADGFGIEAAFQYPSRLATDANGNVYVTDLFNYKIRKITPDGLVSTLSGSDKGNRDGLGEEAQFDALHGIVVDEQETVFVVDTGNNSIRKIIQE